MSGPSSHNRDAITCANCGTDLSRGKRAKDNNSGLYYCPAFALHGECEPATASGTDRDAQEQQSRRPAVPVRADDPQSDTKPDEAADIYGIDLEPVENAASNRPRSVKPSAPRTQACPVCLTTLTDQQRCFGCGFDSAKGLLSSSKVLKSKDQHGTRTVLCPKCTYDMGAGTAMTCPECGTTLPIEDKTTQYARQSKETARQAYLQPLLMLGIAGLIMMGVWFANLGLLGLAVYPIYLIAITLLGTFVFQLMCLTFIGFDAPLHLTVLRLAGIYAVMSVVDEIAGWIPLPCVPILVSLLVYVGLLMQMLDLEVNDAVILALGVGLVQILVGIALAMTVLSSF
jgi:hypothetical protein